MVPLWAQAGELSANQIHRDPYGMIHAEGDVHLQAKDFTIQAKQLNLDVDAQSGDMVEATVTFDSGHILSGDYLKRIDLAHFSGKNIIYTDCPEDAWAWAILADSATLDQEEGTFVAKNARFEWGGIPLLYVPRWEHALSRRSGFLMPKVGNSSRRGAEFIAPFYWAASPDWDMTLTPRWMSLRGTMADVEWRHRSKLGREEIQIQSIHDQQTGKQRSRVRTDMVWRPATSIDAMLNIDAVNDGLYIADFPSDGDVAAAAYLTSTAALSWRDGSDSAILSSRYQQVLGGASNTGTLQILPRVETRHYFNVGEDQTIKLAQQTTNFKRDVGVSGVRVGLQPSWSKPWQMQGGAVSATWSVLGQYVGYESKQFNDRSSSYGALASSLQMQAIFERISENKQWRHEIKPVLRVDVSQTKNQSNQPRYDSSLLPLSFSNLLQGNRYSGWDRFERMRRVSMLLASSLQNKDNTGDVRTVLQGQVGLVWDGLRETVDANVAAAPTRVVSNVLAEMAWMPFANWRATMGGQHNPDLKQWVERHASLSWSGESQQYFNMAWQQTQPSYATEAKAFSLAGKTRLSQRWSSSITSQYDVLRKHMNHTTIGAAYHHACWDFSMEGFKNYQVGSKGLTDMGWRFLLVFEGLGSFGDS